MVKGKRFVLTKDFEGFPKESDFKLEEYELASINEGEFLAEAVYLSVDPYMRAKASSVGKTMTGFQVAKHTSYFGFLELCQPKSGETVVVSGAAGAVGSHVGQIAKIKGCTVIGIAGSDEKGKWLTEELGFDHFINYKTANIAEELKKAAPNGVDCYFDNVGGELSSIVIFQMNLYGRISVCGSISSYNESERALAPMLQRGFAGKQLKMEGFMAYRWNNRFMEGVTQNLEWIKEAKLKYQETVTKGFENMVKAFIGMLKGENVGKAIVEA
ncbi:unnamed protein product [Diabrotica balteata]|uniref:15-oxoprostaglandin 13-reductase n=1 Tax=Diabrotica balteata TaxID=107213 RepID=A0A9N9T0V6_DIABA|nr:unnamed protein product [Diabrotica balteata]